MKTVCRKCKGLGWIANPDSPKDFKPLDCPDCNGTGILTISNSTDGQEKEEGEEAPSLTNKEKANQR